MNALKFEMKQILNKILMPFALILYAVSSCSNNIDYRYAWFTYSFCSEEHQVFIPIVTNGFERVYCGSIDYLYSIIDTELSESDFRVYLYNLSKTNQPLQLDEGEYRAIDPSQFVTPSTTVEQLYNTRGTEGLLDEIRRFNKGDSHLSMAELYDVLYRLWINNLYIIWDYDDYPDIVISVTRADL